MTDRPPPTTTPSRVLDLPEMYKPNRNRGRGRGRGSNDRPQPPRDPNVALPIGRSPPQPPEVPTPSHLHRNTKTTFTESKHSMSVDFFGINFDYALTPVESRVEYNIDASGLAGIVESTYDSLRVCDNRLTTQVPFCLYQYYCYELFWYRALYVCNRNRTQTGQDVDDFLNTFGHFDVYVPKIIDFWLNGLGNTKSPFGDLVYARLYATPGANGTFGACTGNTVSTYASLPAPQVVAEYISQTLAANAAAPPPADWNPANILPHAPQGHSYRATKNLVGWSPVRELTRKGKSALTDLGWTPNLAATPLVGPQRLHLKTMIYVSNYLRDLASKFEITQLSMSSEEGSTNILPYIITDAAEPGSERSVDVTVEQVSQYQLAPLTAANAFVFGYRVKRTINAGLTNSTSYPLFYSADAQPQVRVDLPAPADVNHWFAGCSGNNYLNSLFFRGNVARRVDRIDTVCTKYVKEFKS